MTPDFYKEIRMAFSARCFWKLGGVSDLIQEIILGLSFLFCNMFIQGITYYS